MRYLWIFILMNEVLSEYREWSEENIHLNI